MTGDWQNAPALDGPPPEFVELVKETLERLYDFPYLQGHPLAQAGRLFSGEPGETDGQRLRHALVAAIETLNPGPDVPFHALHARLYNLLLLHYMEGLTIQEAAHELGISRRQAHRDLRRGCESIAAILWSRQETQPQPPQAIRLSSVEAEMARLETHPRPVDAGMLLEGARQAVEPLARQQAVEIRVDRPAGPVIVSADPALARQVLVNLLSHVVGQAQPGPLDLALTAGDGRASLAMRYLPASQASRPPAMNAVLAQLADRLGWTVQQAVLPGGVRQVVLDMTPRGGSTVLIIDDNEGLVELLTDYLSGHACRVVAATSGPEGLRLAEELAPDAVVLDVMLPEMDGWELLQRLRHQPQTAATPVIICSVLNNPELAYSLGASLVLSKPVSRNDVLGALRRLQVV